MLPASHYYTPVLDGIWVGIWVGRWVLSDDTVASAGSDRAAPRRTIVLSLSFVGGCWVVWVGKVRDGDCFFVFVNFASFIGSEEGGGRAAASSRILMYV